MLVAILFGFAEIIFVDGIVKVAKPNLRNQLCQKKQKGHECGLLYRLMQGF